MDMPCSHRMRKLELEGKSLEPDDFHAQWHLPNTPADTILPLLSQAEANSKEDYEQQFLQEVFERFQKLPTHKKPGYLANFTRLLDQTHSLTQIEDPLEQTHKGRSRGPTKKKTTQSARSTKRDPSAFEHQIPKNKVGRPRKLIDTTVGEPDTSVGDPPKGRGRPRKETGPSVGTKRKQVTGTVKGNKKNKRSASKSESGSASETDGMNASDLPEVPLDIVTRSGRVINRPSKSGATTVKPMVEKEKNESDSDIDSDEYLPDAPQAVPNDCDKEKPNLPVDGDNDRSLSDSDDEEQGNVWKKFNQV
ncbi:hypothetical protein PSTG_17974 [Puccinia striiformis f. sp. tritici PST-78]|uniref:Uncharacterized protein n=1 Tax=Puccinia striiformis f. sp. tritici PST-78 TaxID=1165861 RepID=A0A0L0UNK9_9BASI|nr:hypothetical protein PSTG_17974 [Puccinia striiformis f. sp. tritici PST-78]